MSTFVVVGSLAGCGTAEEAESPTFQITSPEFATTTTSAPVRLAWLGNPDLTGPERDMCAFIDSIDRAVSQVDDINAAADLQMEAKATDRTLAEPLRVRLKRDTAVANARRLGSAFASFGEGASLIERIDPNERVPAEQLAATKADIDRVVAIGEEILEAANRAAPLSASDQTDFETRTGEEWVDLLTERELDAVLADLTDPVAGTGLEIEARSLLDSIDDWSWRQCSEGFSD